MPRILLIEDDPFLRSALEAYLEHQGYGVEVTDRAPEACSILSRKTIDLVITDVHLPGDGFSVLEYARAHRPGTPVIMITGRPEPAGEALARRQGAFRYLAKPVSGAELEAVVHRALETRQESAPSLAS